MKSWKCPFCNHFAMIGEKEEHIQQLVVESKKYLRVTLVCKVVECPNPKCNELVLYVKCFQYYPVENGPHHANLLFHNKRWQLIPESQAIQFPNFIPRAIREDYTEACLICDLSPKASATLSRRCIQSMIRDFWEVNKKNLFQEIDAIKDKVEIATWEAIDAVRKIGNIGAHMERDINLIIDVSPEEARTLVRLVEMLINDWYIQRNERQKHLEEIVAISAQKEEEKNGKPSDE